MAFYWAFVPTGGRSSTLPRRGVKPLTAVVWVLPPVPFRAQFSEEEIRLIRTLIFMFTFSTYCVTEFCLNIPEQTEMEIAAPPGHRCPAPPFLTLPSVDAAPRAASLAPRRSQDRVICPVTVQNNHLRAKRGSRPHHGSAGARCCCEAALRDLLDWHEGHHTPCWEKAGKWRF